MAEDFYCEEVFSGKTQVEKVFETENVLAYHHTRPFWETHIVVVPKKHVDSLLTVDNELLMELLDVVEHLDSDVAGLREMYRVTKRGGYSLIFVPAFMWLWGVQDDISHHRIRYTKKQIVDRLKQAGYTVERATYANWTFFAPILAGRTLMRLTGIKPESENNVNVSALNGVFGKLFSAERFWLKRFSFPFGVSIVVVARKS